MSLLEVVSNLVKQLLKNKCYEQSQEELLYQKHRFTGGF